MKNYLQIFINQRFWKQVDTTVDTKGAYDFEPAVIAIKDAEAKNDFVLFGLRSPSEITSVEVRPLTVHEKVKM